MCCDGYLGGSEKCQSSANREMASSDPSDFFKDDLEGNTVVMDLDEKCQLFILKLVVMLLCDPIIEIWCFVQTRGRKRGEIKLKPPKLLEGFSLVFWSEDLWACVFVTDRAYHTSYHQRSTRYRTYRCDGTEEIGLALLRICQQIYRECKDTGMLWSCNALDIESLRHENSSHENTLLRDSVTGLHTGIKYRVQASVMDVCLFRLTKTLLNDRRRWARAWETTQ